MAEIKRAMISIMPTIDGRRRPDFYHSATMTTDLPDEAMGEAIGDCMRAIWKEGFDPVLHQVSLEVKFA